MAKILNIDSLATEKRFVRISGVEYPIVDMTVQHFIETSKMANDLEGATILEQVEATVKFLQRSVPELPEATIRALSLENMQVIVSFVRGEHLVEGVENSDPNAPEEAKKKVAQPKKVKAVIPGK